MTKVEISFKHLPTTAISDATGGIQIYAVTLNR